MTPGQHMKSARNAAGLRMIDLANRAGISYATVWAMEAETRNPSILVVEACADVLGLSIDEYIGHKVREVKHNKERNTP